MVWSIRTHCAMNGIDFLADTNILIYTLEGHPGVKSILPYSFALSVISEIELLGKTGILEEEIEAIRDLLNDCTLIELSETIKTRAIQLKQKQKIRLPDAIIAATAIEFSLPLVTADKRLEKIEGLNCLVLEL
jgi:predicted nucleic acid-binding protein